MFFQRLKTPGHTPESVTYAVYVKDAGEKCRGAFTGDVLFVGDSGRTDLPDPDKTGENARILYDAIHRNIAPLGDCRTCSAYMSPSFRRCSSHCSA